MNERIKQIAGQALDRAVPQTWTTLTAYDLNKFTEAFAELLVRECMLCCERVISDPVPESVDTWLNGGSQCIDEIKKHFGVEE